MLGARIDLVANQVELAWLTLCPLSKKIIVDRGKEVLVKLESMMVNDYKIPCISTSTRHLQANAMMKSYTKPLKYYLNLKNLMNTFEK